MRKGIIPLLSIVAVCIGMLCPLCAGAVTPLDPAADAGLTLTYQKDGETFPDLQIELHRVAEAFPDGTFELVEPFASYPVNIHDITEQEQWRRVASTLVSYIVANGKKPDREALTDDAGIAGFDDLETGLYLVREVMAEKNGSTYLFDGFMVYVPTPEADGSYDYEVEAKPKCAEYVPKTEYRVTKLWQDVGNQTTRPGEVTVDIYKDGELQETKILSAENNWTYSWYVSENESGIWTVAERVVHDTYTVSVQQNGSSFSIINTRLPDHDVPDAPQTGDTFAPMPWLMIMCFCGIILLLIGVYGRRHA